MKTLLVSIIFVMTLLLVVIGNAHAATAASTGLDFSPLIPVINGLIVAVAGVLSASVPVIVAYFVIWLRQHSINLSQSSQKIISDRIAATIQNGLKYATANVDEKVVELKINVPNQAVAAAARYAIAQSPELLKKAGIDITTEEGQQALVRRIVAESMPTPPALSPSSNVNVTTEPQQEVK